MKNLVAALESSECPTFAARGAPGTKPIQQNQTCARVEVKFLPLGIGGTGKGLDRIGRQHQERVSLQFSAQGVAARAAPGIAVNFGRSLRREKATGAGAQAHVKAGFISGHKTAAKTAKASPDTVDPRGPWDEKLHRI